MLDILDLCIPWGSLVLIDEVRRFRWHVVKTVGACSPCGVDGAG